MLKKRFSNKINFSKLWGIYHAGIFAAFLISLIFTHGINFDSDYTNMLPSSSHSEAAKIAEKAISSTSNNSVFILVQHDDFDTAKKVAEQVYDELSQHKSKFDTLMIHADTSSFWDTKEFISKWRFNLLDDETKAILSSKAKTEVLAQNSLASVFEMLSDVSSLEEDPFLLDEVNLRNYVSVISDSGTALSPKDGVLATNVDGKWYVLIRALLSQEGAALASDTNAVPLIYSVCEPLEKDGVYFVYYGTPFHSYASSSNATREISNISIVSLLAVVLILLFVFRSPLPIFASVCSIICSLGIAFCSTHLIFGQIHMIALVFGTSLIGSCIDYSVHYFVNWKGSPQLKTPEEVRAHLFAGLILSLVSTEICFGLLLFAPFLMLKQMAVFSFTGIMSSFLTVNGLFTKFKFPPAEKRHLAGLTKLTYQIRHRKVVSIVTASVILCITSVILFTHRDGVKIENDLNGLYKLEGRLKDDTFLAYRVINYQPSNWLVVSGETAEEVLQKEEALMPYLPKEDKYICTARFIPSMKKQKESAEACANLIPFAKEQYEYLQEYFDFDPDCLANFKNSIKDAAENFISPDDELPESLRSILDLIWVGNVDGKYYSVILPSRIKSDEPYIELASKDDNLYFENKIKDISEGLDEITKIILLMFGIAFCIIAVVMKIFYNWKYTLKILSIPVLSILVITSVFVLSGLKIEFFCITGVILVFGLGLDYVIYKLENKDDRIESVSIMISFLTTAISFGALMMSSFIPVHVLGLSIFSGLITAFICAVL
ncbi:MAG: hypothetical protein J6Y93_04985 [Treponema sp.]|nr:hypothetical protein [Treponema sp.]